MRKVVLAACAVLGCAAGLDTAQAQIASQRQATRVEHDPEARLRAARRFADDEMSRLQGQITTLSSRYNVRKRTLWAIAEASGFDLNRRSFAEFIAYIGTQAQEVVSLRAELERLNADFAALPDRSLGGRGAQLLAQVQSAIDEGRLEEAEQRLLEVIGLFARGVQQNEQEWRRAVLSRAQILRISGRDDEEGAYLRQTRLGFVAAAQEATRQTAFVIALREADSHRHRGERLGEIAALHRAVEVYRLDVLSLAPRATAPQDWATTQNDLGLVLWTLGDRQSGVAGLRTLAEAKAAFEAALEVRTRAQAPYQWAATQNNLGLVLQTLGQRQSGVAGLSTLAEAKDAFEAALEVRTRAEAPYHWAQTKNNLGNVLQTLGQRQSGEESLRTLAKAKAAYEAALEVTTRAEAPYDWATTQHNLGAVLQTLGERQSGEAGLTTLAEAKDAYEVALEVRTRDQAPYDWAVTQSNLVLLHWAWFEKTQDRGHVERSLGHARAALALYEETGAQDQVSFIRDWIAELEAL